MELIRRVFWLHLLAAGLGLAIGYLLNGAWLAGLVFLALAGGWAAAHWRRIPGLGGLVLFVFFGAAAFGLLSGVPGWLMVLVGVMALGAWDLDHFLRRLERAHSARFETGLRRNHLARLAQVEGIGFGLGLAVLMIRIHLGLGWVILLGLLVVAGLSRMIAFIRKEAEQEGS